MSLSKKDKQFCSKAIDPVVAATEGLYYRSISHILQIYWLMASVSVSVSPLDIC
jgi:hypothetical protein